MELLCVKNTDAFNASPLLPRYRRVRIPGIVALESGVMLVYYECRAGGDWSAIDIGCQRSDDGGKTWSETRMLACGRGRNAMNNPVMIAHGDTVHLLYCENYKRLFIRQSTDAGRTWSDPRELTAQIDAAMPDCPWTVLAVGPGHGVRLSAGRLLVPVWFGVNPDDMFSHHPSFSSVLLSDTGGETWYPGGRLGTGMEADFSECCAAETPDGRVVISIRSEAPEKLRQTAWSSDGGVTWTAPVFDARLPDPTCCAGLCRAGDALLFTNCASKTARENLTVKRIENGEITDALCVSKAGGYSDVCYNAACGRAFVAYETETAAIHVAEIKI